MGLVLKQGEGLVNHIRQVEAGLLDGHLACFDAGFGAGFAVGYGLAEALGYEGSARGVLIIECAMPVAVFNYLYAQLPENRPEEVAGTVLVSTVLSFLTLPALLWFVL